MTVQRSCASTKFIAFGRSASKLMPNPMALLHPPWANTLKPRYLHLARHYTSSIINPLLELDFSKMSYAALPLVVFSHRIFEGLETRMATASASTCSIPQASPYHLHPWLLPSFEMHCKCHLGCTGAYSRSLGTLNATVEGERPSMGDNLGAVHVKGMALRDEAEAMGGGREYRPQPSWCPGSACCKTYGSRQPTRIQTIHARTRADIHACTC